MLEYLRNLVQAALEARDAAKSKRDEVTAEARAANDGKGRDLTEAETNAYREASQALAKADEALDEARERYTEALEVEAREGKLAEVRASVASAGDNRTEHGAAVVTREERTYRAYKDERGEMHLDPAGPSFFRDLVKHSLNLPGAAEARTRLERSRKEDEVEARKEQRALSTTDGAGGDFVPPAWLVQEYIALARAARPTADRVRNLPLPSGTDSLNIPRIASGTATAEQTSQNTGVQNTDATTNSISAAVVTIAGQQVIAVQLIEQSPVNLDEILLADLALDYATKINTFVLTNNAASKRGLFNVSGINAVTLSTTGFAALYPKLADATQQIYSGRFLPPDTIVMHPRRWASLLGSLDSASRPLVVPSAQGPTNALAQSNGLVAQGVAGEIAGLPVVVDPSIPTNLGAGTNQDEILVFRAADSILWEGPANAEAFRETKADQLSVLLRFYRYAAFTGERYPKAISAITGTGLVAPTF